MEFSRLDERTAVLALSVIFHHKAEQYVENVPTWKNASENLTLPSEIMLLENSIHQHQNLYESMCQAYTEVNPTTIFSNFSCFVYSSSPCKLFRCITRIKPCSMGWTWCCKCAINCPASTTSLIKRKNWSMYDFFLISFKVLDKRFRLFNWTPDTTH